MSFFEFQMSGHSASMDSHVSPVPSLPPINSSPRSANPSSQSAHSVLAANPASGNAPQQVVFHTPVSNSRTRLDQGDQLVLVRLCVLNQSDYAEGKKGEFWSKISILLEEETGKQLKDPGSTMKLLVAGRRVYTVPL